jgi:hypothetical protein
MKRLLKILVVLLVLLGVPYGLAKFGVIPVGKLTAKNPAAAKVARMLGLLPRQRTVKADTKPSEPPSQAAPAPPPVRSVPPASQNLPSPTPVQSPSPDDASRQIGWLAKVYENMEPEEAVSILEKMSDREVIPLLRRMKQRQVAQILALLPPDRAARLCKTLMVQR